MIVWPAVTAAPAPVMSGCTTSCVGGAASGTLTDGLPVSPSVTTGNPSAGATASPVARASGVRTPFTSTTNSNVSFFFTFFAPLLWAFAASPSFGESAMSTRLPTDAPTRPETRPLAVTLASSTVATGVAPNDEPSSAPVRPSTTR